MTPQTDSIVGHASWSTRTWVCPSPGSRRRDLQYRSTCLLSSGTPQSLDDRPYAVWSAKRVRDGTPRSSGAHTCVECSDGSRSEVAGVCHSRSPDQTRSAPRLALPKIAIGQAAVETLGDAEPSSWAGAQTATRAPHAARQCLGPDHGNAE
jgi:hypothetical protein